jgi:uncharacterized protein (TIGR03435 family)
MPFNRRPERQNKSYYRHDNDDDDSDPELIAPLIRSLLRDRFGPMWHNEERTGTAYSLVAAKAKLKKADLESRIYCRNAPPAEPGAKRDGAEL